MTSSSASQSGQKTTGPFSALLAFADVHDLTAAALTDAIKRLFPGASIVGWGAADASTERWRRPFGYSAGSSAVSLMKYLPKLCRIAVGALMFLILCIQGEQASAQTSPISEVFRNNLQKWIERDHLHFFKDSRGAARLFLRRETVRFALVPSSIPMREEVTGLIAELSKAAGVAHEETSTDVNLAIVVDSPINVGEKINPALWKRVGLSEEMYKIVEETGNWASGCGAYSFGNANTGQVGLSIVLADSKLDVPNMRDCLIDGVLKAFGARADRRSILISEDGYYQFVPLVRALARCEQSIGVDRLVALKESEQKSKYAECAADLLSK